MLTHLPPLWLLRGLGACVRACVCAVDRLEKLLRPYMYAKVCAHDGEFSVGPTAVVPSNAARTAAALNRRAHRRCPHHRRCLALSRVALLRLAQVPNDMNTKRAVERSFGDFDTDSSKSVSINEFIAALERYGMHVAGRRPGAGGLPMAVVQALFDKYDVDSSGSIDYKEVCGRAKAEPCGSRASRELACSLSFSLPPWLLRARLRARLRSHAALSSVAQHSPHSRHRSVSSQTGFSQRTTRLTGHTRSRRLPWARRWATLPHTHCCALDLAH